MWSLYRGTVALCMVTSSYRNPKNKIHRNKVETFLGISGTPEELVGLQKNRRTVS
jgi:hypothetical protein